MSRLRLGTASQQNASPQALASASKKAPTSSRCPQKSWGNNVAWQVNLQVSKKETMTKCGARTTRQCAMVAPVNNVEGQKMAQTGGHFCSCWCAGDAKRKDAGACTSVIMSNLTMRTVFTRLGALATHASMYSLPTCASAFQALTSSLCRPCHEQSAHCASFSVRKKHLVIAFR